MSVTWFKKIFITTLTLASLSFTAKALAPDTVKIGTYIISIHDIDFKNKEYTIRYWLWMIYKNKDFDFENRVEVSNAKSTEKPDVFVDSTNNQNWVLLKMKSVMKQPWKVGDFPFDKQHLVIKIENSAYDNNSLIFQIDTMGQNVAPEVTIDGWTIKDIILKTNTSVYNSAFGDARIKTPHTEYDSVEIHIDLERAAWGLFFKIFIGMYVAFMIGYVSFFIHQDHVEASFGLQVGGLFAAVGNKYITDSALPETSVFTLVDSLHAVTFICLFLIILGSAIGLVYYKRKRIATSRKVLKYFSIITLAAYILINFMFVLVAIKDVGFF